MVVVVLTVVAVVVVVAVAAAVAAVEVNCQILKFSNLLASRSRGMRFDSARVLISSHSLSLPTTCINALTNNCSSCTIMKQNSLSNPQRPMMSTLF